MKERIYREKGGERERAEIDSIAKEKKGRVILGMYEIKKDRRIGVLQESRQVQK
jgi:hypothetical protein